jgi:Rrf2 family transcriptional regulator, nitric oxide-sensitive transcriptional repressor
VKLQMASQLALYALFELAKAPGAQLSVAEIGERYGVSTHHLAKVMHTLGRARLVRAVRGVGGGYQFSGNAKRTTLLDVVQLFGDFLDAPEPVAANGVRAEIEALRDVGKEIDDVTRATLGSITLATMLNLIERRRRDPASGATPAQLERRIESS